MGKTDEELWERLWLGIREMSDLLEGRPVFIGGIAVYLHVVGTKKDPPVGLVEHSHDGDFYLSLEDYSTLRHFEEVTKNDRLKKLQVIKDGVDFYIYLEHSNSLRVSYEDAYDRSEVIDGIRVVCLEHLLLLKLAAYADRQRSAKGRKDERDVIRICYLLSLNPFDGDLLRGSLTRGDLALLERVYQSSEFLVLAKRNAHAAKKLRDAFGETLKVIK